MWWDFEEAARFLRVNADKYGLDPNAFGAVGISAGGWLITTSGHADVAVVEDAALRTLTRTGW